MTKASPLWSLLLASLLLIGTASITSCRDRQVPLFVISGPTGIQSFQMATEDGEILWFVTATEPTTLSRIEYGVVPEGFHQVAPRDDQLPRFLIPGEWIETETVSVDATFYHAGPATSPVTIDAVTSRLKFKQPE